MKLVISGEFVSLNESRATRLGHWALKGATPWNKGRSHSLAARAKMSAKAKLRRPTEEHRQKIAMALRGRKGKTHTAETREKLRLMAIGRKQTVETISKRVRHIMGEKNPNWKGGITPKNIIVRNSRRSVEWRVAVFERDGYVCVTCGAKSVEGNRVVLNADHIKPFAFYPDLRFDLSNGRTLCVPCHKQTDTYCRRFPS